MAFNADRILEFQRGRIEGWATCKAMQEIAWSYPSGSEEWHAAMRRFQDATDQWEQSSGSEWRYVMYVNLVEIDQGYGGPQEGGWYYDITTPVATIPVIDAGSAIKAIELLITFAKDQYGDERPRYSAAGGKDASIYFDDSPAKSEPEERPHYE